MSTSTAYKVDTSKGTTHGAVQGQWFNRPDDQRFLNLNDLHAYVHGIADQCSADIVDVREIEVKAKTDEPDKLALILPQKRSSDKVIAEPTHWSFGQMCSLLGAPAGYLRKLPSTIAGINLQYALANFRQELVKSYVRQNGTTELRAATGPEYGRIFDHEVVAAVQKLAGNGVGDTHWKIPGVLNWKEGTYEPDAPVTKRSTTLFASDRDVFMFLVDDKRPIEIGKLADGSPDLIFRGFYVWNSEVGSKALGIATFYLRGVCENRLLWGVEGFSDIKLRHSKNAPDRFASEAGPALEQFTNHRTETLLAGVEAARKAIVAKNDDERSEFLQKQGFSRNQAKTVIETVVAEEGKAPESIWDFVQSITAAARDKGHQDDRIAMERIAGKLLDKVTIR